MKRIKKSSSIFFMSKDIIPAEQVHSGETVIFETADCYNDQIVSEKQSPDTLKNFSNPATGPLFIEEAEPGDVLKVEIIDIKINDHGVMLVRPNAGVLGKNFRESRIKIIAVKDQYAIFSDKIKIPLKPMIGVIGVSPKEGSIKTTVPDIHGGNMDCNRITKGAVLYLPVFVKGALLAMGDLHGVMADGEIVICGMETGGEVTVRITVIKNKALPLPMVISHNQIMTIASERTLDEAAVQATKLMHGFLTDEVKMDTYEAGMLLSLSGNLRICQVVDPKLTARMELPLSVLEAYGVLLP